MLGLLVAAILSLRFASLAVESIVAVGAAYRLPLVVLARVKAVLLAARVVGPLAAGRPIFVD